MARYDHLTPRYLTSKLVADSLMWQQTFRNDSPSPEEWPGHSPEEVICQLDFVSMSCIRAQVQSLTLDLEQGLVQVVWSMRDRVK